MILFLPWTCTYTVRSTYSQSTIQTKTRRLDVLVSLLPPHSFSTPPCLCLCLHLYCCTSSRPNAHPQSSSFLGLGSPKTGGPPGVELRTLTRSRSRSRPGLEFLLLFPLANGNSVGAANGAMRRTLAGGRPTNRWSDQGRSYRASTASATKRESSRWSVG